METDCLVSGRAQSWEFIIPRRVCEPDSIVTRDASGSHFLGPLKGSGAGNTSSGNSLGRSSAFHRCLLLLFLRIALFLAQKAAAKNNPDCLTFRRDLCIDVASWGMC